MAKQTRNYQLKGDYYHDKQVIAEYDKRTETTTYYSVKEILEMFDGAEISITIAEQGVLPSIEDPFND